MLLKYLPKDKIIKVKESEEKTPQDEADDFAKLRENGIQVEAGLRYSQNDEALYRTLLSEYILSFEEKFNSIKKFCEAEDCEQYGIVVHALKSSSRMIGATELSEVCAQLEKASDNSEIETIQERTPALLEFYEKVINAIRSAGVVDAEVQSKSDDEILEFFPET